MSNGAWQNLLGGPNQFVDQLVGKSLYNKVNRTPVRAVLTDFDGVMSDNDRIQRESYETLKAHNFHDLPEWENTQQFSHSPLAFLRMQNLNEEEEKRLYYEGRAIYEHSTMHLLQDAVSTMKFYESINMPWAVVSNNHYTKVRWQELGLAEMFPHIAVFDNAQKPDDKFLREALGVLNQPAGRDVIMVDDEWKGLVAAAGLGLTPVYFGNKPHLVLPVVEKECKDRGIAVPYIAVVRDNAELQQLVANGLQIPGVSAAPHL